MIYSLYGQKFSNLRPLRSIITFPLGLQKSKNKFGHWSSGSGGTKTVKRSEKHLYQKSPAQQNSPQNKLYFRVIFTPFISKIFKSETTSFNFFCLKGSESLKKTRHPTSGSGGKKTFRDIDDINDVNSSFSFITIIPLEPKCFGFPEASGWVTGDRW